MEKSLVKKSKKPLIVGIICGVLLLAGTAAFYFLYWKNRNPEIILSDAEYRIQTESWEKVDAPTVIWSFKEGGKGELTTNKSNYYSFTWTLEKGDPSKLRIKTAWLLELDDTFEFSYNREEKSFYVKNLADDTESTFVPLGTAASEDCGEDCPTEGITEATAE